MTQTATRANKRFRGKEGHYMKMCLKYKPEFDQTGGSLVIHKNPHSGTPATMKYAIECLIRLLRNRAYGGKIWRAQIYQHPGNTLIMDWREGQHLTKPHHA